MEFLFLVIHLGCQGLNGSLNFTWLSRRYGRIQVRGQLGRRFGVAMLRQLLGGWEVAGEGIPKLLQVITLGRFFAMAYRLWRDAIDIELLGQLARREGFTTVVGSPCQILIGIEARDEVRSVGARPIFLRRARRGNTQGMEPVLMD